MMNLVTKPDDEVVDEPLSADDLGELRRARKNLGYLPTSTIDPVHECFSDKQLLWLGPFLKSREAPDPESLDDILSNHPVRLARPGQGCERFALEALIQLCDKMGSAWNDLRSAVENRLVRVRDSESTTLRATQKPR